MYGMGEHSIYEAAQRLDAYSHLEPDELAKDVDLCGIRGTCWRTGKKEDLSATICATMVSI